MLPRWMHKLYAKRKGYFWLPCPICGRMFGGHEKPRGRLAPTDEPNFFWASCSLHKDERD